MTFKIKIKVTPNSIRDEISGYLGEDILKIKIKAKPIKGKANTYLLRYLSKELKIPQKNLSIVKGKTSRIKILEVSNIEKVDFTDKLPI